MGYAGRSLTTTERHYSQVKRIAFPFDHYTHGRQVTVESDHKPLEPAPKRPQRMLLRVQKYKINIVSKGGKTMHIVDALARAYLPYGDLPEEKLKMCNSMRK